MSYKADYGKYVYLHRALDHIAYESAEMAADGADESEAWQHAEELLRHTVKNLNNIKIRNYRCAIDHHGEFVIARIRMDVENLFRFPFLPVTSIVAERKMIVISENMQYNSEEKQ